jgi:hypothetical protein
MMVTAHEARNSFMIIARSVLLRPRIFQTKVVEEVKTSVSCPIKVFPVVVPFMRDIVEKYGRTR